MDASGFRPWKYYRTGPGKKRSSADPDRVSDRNPGKGICGKLHCGNDHGIRNHGDYAGSNGYKHALQSCYVLCNLRWCNCTESCK